MNKWIVEEAPAQAQVAVIGGGLAALHAAGAALEAGASVLLASSGRLGSSGASAVSMSVHRFAPNHPAAAAEHVEQMMTAGRGLNRRDLVTELVREAPVIPTYLTRFMPELEVKSRVIDQTAYPCFADSPSKRGGTLSRLIRKQLEPHPGLRLLEGWSAFYLEPSGPPWRLWLVKDNRLLRLQASALVLATGGYLGLYAHHSGTGDLTGGGLALAWRAGLKLQDLEMVQFYPYRIHSPRICDIFPDIFMHGARLMADGVGRFMEAFPKKELENRDVLAREIFKHGGAWLDLSECDLNFLAQESPRLFKLRTDFPERRLKIFPLTHFTMGGICTGLQGQTGRDGLWACGEIAGGLHGANRLAGQALSETVVFGLKAGRSAGQYALAADLKAGGQGEPPAWLPWPGGDDPAPILNELKELMWAKVGLIRRAADLNEALKAAEVLTGRLAGLRPSDLRAWLTAQNALAVAEGVIKMALLRTESRGAHFREDFPLEDESQMGNYFYQGDRIWFEAKPH